VNAVSQLHGQVTREMWAPFYGKPVNEVPVGAITNGVHLGTWDDHQVLSGLVAAAKAGGGPGPDHSDPDHTVLRAAHAHDDVRGGVARVIARAN